MRKGTMTGGGIAAALGLAAFLFLFYGQSNPSAAAPMHLAEDGHYTTPVTINGQGPFEFVVDTGAHASTISPELASKLKLMEMGGVQIHATSGTGAGRMAILETYSSALFSRTGAMMGVLPSGGIVKDGVIGMNLFTARRLELDFAQGSVRASDSGPTPAGYLAIPATIVQGSFIVTDAVVDGIRVEALIDSGAHRTVGNSLLRQALHLADGDPRLSSDAPVGGATADTTRAIKAQVGALVLGTHRFEKPVITFADVPVLEILGLADGPALIVGLDQLKQLKAVAIDYPRSELQLKP